MNEHQDNTKTPPEATVPADRNHVVQMSDEAPIRRKRSEASSRALDRPIRRVPRLGPSNSKGHRVPHSAIPTSSDTREYCVVNIATPSAGVAGTRDSADSTGSEV